MGATAEEREVNDLIKEHGRFVRFANHGDLYEFGARGSGVVVLVGRNVSGKDAHAWKNVLADVKRAIRRARGEIVNENEKETTNMESPKVTTPTTARVVLDNRPGALAGLIVKKKEKRLIMTEETSAVELAPHHVQALLRGAGFSVPDDAKVTFTAEGYVRISWIKTTETQEG